MGNTKSLNKYEILAILTETYWLSFIDSIKNFIEKQNFNFPKEFPIDIRIATIWRSFRATDLYFQLKAKRSLIFWHAFNELERAIKTKKFKGEIWLFILDDFFPEAEIHFRWGDRMSSKSKRHMIKAWLRFGVKYNYYRMSL